MPTNDRRRLRKDDNSEEEETGAKEDGTFTGQADSLQITGIYSTAGGCAITLRPSTPVFFPRHEQQRAMLARFHAEDRHAPTATTIKIRPDE